MADTAKVLSLLGLGRKASLVAFGHNAAKAALREKRAKLCLLCEDASPRLREEFSFLAQQAGTPLYHIEASSLDIKHATQYKAAVLAVTNKGFAANMEAALQPPPLPPTV